MVGAKVRLPDGKMVDGVDVGIDESTEKWTDIKLADGTHMRVKMSVLSVARSDNDFDPNTGFPVYSLNMTPVVTIIDVPTKLMKKNN